MKDITVRWGGISTQRQDSEVFIGTVTDGPKATLDRRVEFVIDARQVEYAVIHLIPSPPHHVYRTEERRAHQAAWLRALADKLEEQTR